MQSHVLMEIVCNLLKRVQHCWEEWQHNCRTVEEEVAEQVHGCGLLINKFVFHRDTFKLLLFTV